MSRAPSLCGVILAAGESTRMGTDKALLPWPPTVAQAGAGTFLSAQIRSLSLFTELVIVVVGKNAPAITPIVYAEGASMIVNPDPARGQFSSLQVGLHEVLNRGRDAAMVTLVDRPPVGNPTIQTLYNAFASAIARWKWAVVPEYQGKHGHPILLVREMIEAFLKASPTAIARDIEHHNAEHIEYVAVDDPLVTANINTPEEYAAITTSSPG
jgi:molybdenum cofactor cytidylyltransferase